MGIGDLDRVRSEVETLDSNGDEYEMSDLEESKECIDCGSSFIITQGEVNYFIQHELIAPKRCKPCRAMRKANPAIRTSEPHRTPTFPTDRVSITCHHCGRDAEVPFKPFPGTPVYCKVCWVGIKNIGAPINYN